MWKAPHMTGHGLPVSSTWACSPICPWPVKSAFMSSRIPWQGRNAQRRPPLSEQVRRRKERNVAHLLWEQGVFEEIRRLRRTGPRRFMRLTPFLPKSPQAKREALPRLSSVSLLAGKNSPHKEEADKREKTLRRFRPQSAAVFPCRGNSRLSLTIKTHAAIPCSGRAIFHHSSEGVCSWPT